LTPFINILLLPILVRLAIVIGLRVIIAVVVSWRLLIGLILKVLLVACSTATTQIDVHNIILLVLVLVIVGLIGLLLIIGWLYHWVREFSVRLINLVIVVFK
jgi:hypothetical protein